MALMRRVAYLDGLRALAILLVVLSHVTRYHPWLSAHRHSFWGFMLRQGHGVELFFVLSGFCLTYPTLAKLADKGELRFDLARFAARRAARILPSFWIAIPVLLVFLAVLMRFHLPLPGSMPQHGISATKLVQQALLLDANPVWLNGSFWTLPIEVRWYFFCPVLLWLWIRSPKAFASVGILVLAASHFTRIIGADFLALPGFMLGIVAADFQLHRRPIARYALPLLCVLLVIGLLEARAFGNPRPDPVWEFAMFLFVVAVGEVPVLGRMFAARFFAPIAAASYSIYLVHSPIVAFADHYLPYRLGTPLSVIAGVLLGVFAGISFSYIAERPFRSGPLRERLLSVLDTWIPAALRKAGIEPALVLTQRPVPAPVLELQPEAAVA
jgi:peptidoglycan/LPS O-acetylase OafA/YrhL